ncbi:hypothetical protein DV735_g783, partial [Chaetothyriales sp. CBS 134920]
MGWFFRSNFFEFEFLRVIGTAPVEGAEIGECLAAKSCIQDGNIGSWHETWVRFGLMADNLGAQASEANDHEAARWSFLRASNYWRASEFFLHHNPADPRIGEVFERSVASFKKAIKHINGDVKLLQIPFEDMALPAYLFLPPVHCQLPKGTPLVVHTGGFDSIGEELYFHLASGATRRGYAILIFDGPGQGAVLRLQNQSFRPDWEVVISSVLDYVIDYASTGIQSQRQIDTERIALFGASMGGYLALRGAADPRIKACVSCDGFYDMFDVTRTRMPSWFINSWATGWISDAVFNAVVGLLSRYNFQLAWEFGHSMWAYGVTTPADVMRCMQTFTLKQADGSEFLHRIHGSVLVTGAQDTMYFTPEMNARRIFARLDHLAEDRKALWVGHGVELGGMQAKISAKQILAAARVNGLNIDIAPDFQMGTTNQSTEFVAKFPLGKVPAFEGTDVGSGNTVLFESDAIAQYVAESGPRRDTLLGKDVRERAAIRQWICFSENEIMGPVMQLVMWRPSLADFSLAGACYWGFMQIIDARMRGEFPKVTQWYRRLLACSDVFHGATLIEERLDFPSS